MKYERHEFSALFPELEGNDLLELQEDIAANGLNHSIILHEGKILDGWNRYRACLAAKVKYRTEEFPPDRDALQYSISENLKRRHLNVSQRSIIGAGLEEILAKQAAERIREGGRKGGQAPGKVTVGLESPKPSVINRAAAERARGEAREQAAKIVNVSGKSITDAKTVLKHEPEMAAQIMKGTKDDGQKRGPTVSGVAKKIRDGDDKKKEFERQQKAAAERAAAPLVRLLDATISAGGEFSRCISDYHTRIAQIQQEGVFPRSPKLLELFFEYQNMLRTMQQQLEKEYAQVLQITVDLESKEGPVH